MKTSAVRMKQASYVVEKYCLCVPDPPGVFLPGGFVCALHGVSPRNEGKSFSTGPVVVRLAEMANERETCFTERGHMYKIISKSTQSPQIIPQFSFLFHVM